MRRLFVGGLSHTVTQKELKDRFGKFGDVVDVELRTRTDDEGVPYKTFGYINISISDADLKRCLTVLNKSKWKGGTLQIETAKESFLHRLAQERQAVANQDLQQAAADEGRLNLMDSLSKAGIDNFTMKAAVPGTEVPGHKDWVVSKFGRVLPILQLRSQKGNKARMLKYDPSKYSHNIRKLDRYADDHSTPVSQLTWELEGGDDDISRKRRGEFPSYEPRRPKKSRTKGINICKAQDQKRFEQNNSSDDHIESKQFSIGLTRTQAQRSPDSDVDSDEEICRLVAAQDSSHNTLHQEAGGSQLEVVGLEYLVKSVRKGDEDEYDSADTDELIASRRNLSTPINDASKKAKRRSRLGEEEEKVKAPPPLQTFSCKEDFDLDKKRNKKRVLPVLKPSSVSHSNEEEEEESTGSCSDSEYEAMFSNVTCLEMSFADLQKLAEDASQSSETGSDCESAPGPVERPAVKKGTSPEEILAAIMEDSTSDEDRQRKKKKKTKGVLLPPLPAFQGTKSLQETNDCLRKEEHVKKQRRISEAPQMESRTTGCTETERQEGEEKEALLQVGKRTLHKVPVASESSSSSDEEEEERTTGHQNNVAEKPAAETLLSSQISSEDRVKIFTDEGSVKAAPPFFHRKLDAEKEEELQRKANLRRLSALQQRQKEAEEHKRLIQGALANLDAPHPKAGKRIIFDSDDENHEDEEENKSLAASSKKKLQDVQSEEEAVWSRAVANQRTTKDKFPAPQLFDSSEEEDRAEEEENGFHIRPQFEGQVGKRLMALQYRFGTDERFRMDKRFLEEEEETEANGSCTVEDEALEEEKKKSLSILQNILGSSKQPSSKTLLKAAKFRDVSTLHYDPSKEEHTAFETKTIQTTESKATRRKKREEAQKLPEVSSEIFYEVSSDLKGVFGQTKEDLSKAEEEKTNWDQVEEEDDGGKAEELQSSLLSEDPITMKEESSGFKFSFFGVDAEASGGETTEYKVESIQAPKVSWQQDPRFHDSSSDEEQERQSTASTESEETPLTMDLFFFYPGDTRLKEGPTLFCRSSQLEEQREEWEERRTTLRREVRKKHKDARRKLKAAPKS